MSKLQEQWRPVTGRDTRYEYEVSSHGRVRRLAATRVTAGGRRQHYPERVLAIGLTRGYPQVKLVRENGRLATAVIHKLVAAAFIGPRPDGHDINHRNGDKTDNRPSNLEYVTRGANNHHAYRLGLKRRPIGELSPRAVLTEDQVRYVRAMKGVKLQTDLAEELGCSVGCIANIHAGRNWQHVV